MEIKKIFLILAIIVAVVAPWYINYLPYIFKKSNCTKDNALIEMNQNLNQLNVCNNEEFDLLIKILSQHSSDLQFIHLLPKNEQMKIYSNLLENYVIDAYVVNEYLGRNNINKQEEFKKMLNLYLKIMENNFNMNVFKKNIADKIRIDNEIAKKYYEDNKNTIFANKPFIKIAPGINAHAIIIDDDKKSDAVYEKMLLDKKKTIPIENFNPHQGTFADSIISETLINMKVKEYRKITLENGQKIMLYKLSEEKGEWLDFELVRDKVKVVMEKKLIKDECIKQINKLKSELNIKVSQKNLDAYIESKKLLLKNEDISNNLGEPKILTEDSELILPEDELVEEQKIKQVEQEVAK